MGTNRELRDRFLALTTPEVADALDSFGVTSGLVGIRPAVEGQKLFGPAFTVARSLNDEPGFLQAAEYLDQVARGQVIVIDNLGLETSTCWGGILTRYAQKKGVAGTVIHGVHRDAEVVREAGYPIFSRGAFMITGKGRTRLKALNVTITLGEVAISPGDLLLGDDHGVVVIPAGIVEQVAERAETIREVEDQILHLVLDQGIPLREARQRLRYHELTQPQ